MKAQSMKLIGVTSALLASLTAGCGEYVRSSRSPSQLVIANIEAAQGADDTTFGSFLLSDVITLIEDDNGVPVETFFNDPARVSMRVVLRDLGSPAAEAVPTPLNDVTITRYRVVFRRADGRNTPGVDVPHPFDSAVTFTVPADGTATHGFNLVRHTAKLEAPLAALRDQLVFISTLADVTFYGRDGAGNEVSVTGTIGVEFGNFADPE